jgi:hypothetical protein
MQRAEYATPSLFGLFGNLKEETKTLIKEEVQLAKTEISEKISKMGHNAISLAIGGFVAYAGVIVFLGGLGLLLAFAFEKLGLSWAMSGFIGLALIGLVAAGVGYAFIAKAIKSFSSESMAPEKTIETLKDVKGHEARKPHKEKSHAPEEPKRSSSQIHAHVVATEAMIGDTMDEIGRRLSPRYANERIKQRISAHPYRWNLIAMGTGLLSAFLVKMKIAHAHAHAHVHAKSWR